jgi:hypothetical protein
MDPGNTDRDLAYLEYKSPFTSNKDYAGKISTPFMFLTLFLTFYAWGSHKNK